MAIGFVARQTRLSLGKTTRALWIALLGALTTIATITSLAAAEKARQTPSPRDPWADYRVIIWQPHRADQCDRLKSVGIDAGALIPRERNDSVTGFDEEIAPFLRCGLHWYVENIATDFYAAYHRWTPDHPVNWRFIASKDAYRANPDDLSAFRRNPSLSDPQWLAMIRARLENTVRAHRRYQPLFYNLADEPGIADLSAFWDFDLSHDSLREMRRWLQEQYGSIEKLNRQWDSQFKSWDAVMPMTTAEAMQRSDQNFSAWADFKAWMDVAFARALAAGTRAIHNADPYARSAFEGGQIPGWGGYDYSRLANVVDVMELYDGGGNREIVRALNPQAIILTTSASKGPQETHDIWRSLLRGSRGLVLWDPAEEVVAADNRLGERGKALQTLLREIKSGLGKFLLASQRDIAPIAILYSPASIRTQWMLDWQPKGKAWSARDPKDVYEDASSVRQSLATFLTLLQHSGLEPGVLTSEMIAKGKWRQGVRVLILPQAISLSEAAAKEIQRFVAVGGTVIADGEPARFDEHSRRWREPLLKSLFAKAAQPASADRGKAIYFPLAAPSANDAIDPRETRSFERLLATAGIESTVTLRNRANDEAVNDIEINRWRQGRLSIIALQRDLPDRADDRDQERIVLSLSRPAYLYDLRARKFLGYRQQLDLALDRVGPTILGVAPEPHPLLQQPWGP